MEEVEQQDPSVSWEGPIPILENRESLVVNGLDLNVNSSLALLRGAAEYLGLNRGGSKKAIWNRLNQKVQQMEHEELFLAANKLYQEEARNKGAIQVHMPRQPSQEERELHELTHLPYRDWCDFCIATKARDDNQKVLDHSAEGRRSISSVQLDYAYGRAGGNSKAELTTILVGIDSETRMVLAVPVDGKGADLRGQAEHVVRFTLMLNQYGNVEVIGDNEPTMRNLLAYIQTIRHSLGLQTTITNSQKKVERTIQTLRKQASCLMMMAEDKCLISLEGGHALWSWVYLHAAWLINRFSANRALQATPFELATGRRYAGKVVCFGEHVMVLQRQPGVKQGPQWLPGIWVGKTNEEDLRLVVSGDHVMRGKAIRRTSEPWRSVYLFMVKAKPYRNPHQRRPMKILQSTPMVPRSVRGPGKTKEKDHLDEAEKEVEQRGERDYGSRDLDAEEVERYALEHPAGTPQQELTNQQRGRKHEADGQHEEQPAEKYIRVPPLPLGLDTENVNVGESAPKTPDLPLPQRSQETMLDDSAVEESRPKASRTSPSASPTSLYAPHFAGGIQQVDSRPVDEFQWEQEVADFEGAEEVFEMDELFSDEVIDEGTPPEVGPEELEKIEAAAGQEEIKRLLAMGVLEEPSVEDIENGSILTTRSVFDWRVRNGRWKRRCRYVAREFRGQDQTTAETFAPTLSLAATRLLLATHVIMKWSLSFIDVKDAFLLVPQTKLVFVEQPAWWKPEELEELQNGAKRYWRLARCLPGQRDAASRWFDHLKEALEELGMENHLSLPSLFRHKERDLGMVCHVDDLIVAGIPTELDWFLKQMRSRFVISESGLLPQSDQAADDPVRCLKKRHFFTEEGIVIAPHEKYVPILVELYQLSHRAGKATPESTQMDLEGPPEEILTGGDQHRFRSALGTLLYISQDRVDIQHCVRNLSQFMASPTKRAESELKHLILYLKRTEHCGILLPYLKYKSKKAEILLQPDNLEEVDALESWSDSDWAGDRSSTKRRRHSVSSTMIFLNGCLVAAWSRSQKSIALSSCEAEFLASAGGAAEALQLKELWQFLTKRLAEIRAITDSSSCRAFTERLGVGRLKHIDTRYLWMQLEVKKKNLKMEGIPTLWNMADLGTKRLSRQRREFLMYLIGIMEMKVEGSGQVFCRVGEDAFHEEIRKKNLAKKMKEVKDEMICALVTDESEIRAKVSKSMVKMVTLLLLQPGVYGLPEGETEENYTIEEYEGQNYKVFGWLVYTLMFLVYTIVVLGVGIYVGYVKWKKVFWLRRKIMSWITTDWFEDFHRDGDQQPHRSGLDLREWAVRASVEATGGEWIREPPPPLPAPLRRRRGASRAGRQREGPEGSFDEEEERSNETRTSSRRRPQEEEQE